jgi:hypothetical protein
MVTREMIASSPAFFCGRPMHASVKITNALCGRYAASAAEKRSAISRSGASRTCASDLSTDRVVAASLGRPWAPPTGGSRGGIITLTPPVYAIDRPTTYPFR